MKRVFFLLLLLLVVSLFANDVHNGKTSIKILNQSSNSIDIEFDLPNYQIVTETVGNQTYQRIDIDGTDYLSKEGMPELPVFSGMLAIPYHGSAHMSILSKEENRISGITPYPVQSKVDDQVQPYNFQIDRDFYSNGQLYPEQLVKVNDPAILRDFRVLEFSIQPFSFDPGNKQLHVNKKIIMRFDFDSVQGINEMEPPISYSKSFDPMYRALLMNYDQVRDTEQPFAPERILIIYANSTDNTFLNKLSDFVNWKQQKGYVVTSVSTLVAGSSTSTIKTYIQNAYNNASTRPDYVILIGDASGTFAIPAWNFTWNLRYTGEGDYPYTHLAGNDLLGDVYIGRMSISSTNDFLNLVAKGFAYERDMNLVTPPSWLNKMLLVGDTSSSGISTIYTNKYIKDISYFYNPNYTYSEVYSGSFSSSMNSAINSGVGFMNYRGYIGMSGWSPTSFVNGSKTPHAVIITCGTGTFANSTSTTESFIRLGTASSPSGALTAIGMATTGTHTMLNNCLAGGIFEGLFTYDMHTMGQALLYGKIYLDKVYHAEDAELTQAFAHICNLMGDPTVEAFKGIPGTLRINTPSIVSAGQNILDIAVSEDMAVPSEGCNVTLTQGGTVLFNGITDVNGQVAATLPSTWSGTITATATKKNHLPWIQTINSSDTGSFIYQNVIIDDDNNGTSVGNGNGIVEGGETIELNCNIKNTFSIDQTNVYGILSSTDNNITIVSDSISYGVINAANVAQASTSFIISVSAGCPDQYKARFNMIVHDGSNNNYTVPFILTIRNADLDITAIQIQDGNNQIMDPGDLANLNLTLMNNGTIPADGIYARLSSMSSLVIVTDSLAYFGNIVNSGSSDCAGNPFTINGRIQLVPGMIIPFQLHLYNSTGYSEDESFMVTIGTVTSTDPLGPDAYGYYIYDITDSSYPDVPTYDWVEIAPVEGGGGTALTLNDSGSSSDEGDTTGSVSITTITLPFQFSFYGQLYSQVSICSNGFVALGSTSNGDFRNWHLPGALGPNPMIAAFWDDLCLINGGAVYTYYDAAQHYYVVEWYHTVNGYNRSSLETFEMILYNQQYYPTSLGDGQIKLQYQTFNNVDAGNFTSYSPTHGNYCTVGIKDQTGTRGIEYTFNNHYPTAAATLGNNKALFITGTPIVHVDPHLLIGETVIHNTNSLHSIEPGETADVSISLNNMGVSSAQGVVATISTTDPYVTILNASSVYDPIIGGGTGLNKTYFRLQVSSTCPNDHTIPLSVDITAQGGFSWQRQTTLQVVKPLLQLSNSFINDLTGNGNGIANPGETIKMGINLLNPGTVRVNNVRLFLSTTDPNTQIFNPNQQFGDIGVNDISQKNFTVQIGQNVLPSSFVNIGYTLNADNMTEMTGQISLGIGISGLMDDFESNNGGFAAGGWSWGTSILSDAHSGQKMWGTSLNANYGNNQHLELVSPAVPIGSNATLTFWHKYGFETNYDGGNVYISTDNGTIYNLITPDGGYTSQSLPALANQPGYNGTLNTWTQAVFQLGSFAGSSIKIKWNFQSDNGVVNIGWFIDDVEISGFMQSCGILSGDVTLPDGLTDPKSVLITAGSYSTHADSLGHYELLLPNGTYAVSASLNSCSQIQPQSVVFADDLLTHVINFTFNYLRPIPNISYSVHNQIASFSWNTPIAGSNHFSHFNVYRQIDTDIFRMILETPDTVFVDTLHTVGNYAYYFTVSYNEGDSSP
ncbi:MAG TPA: C25 family cysteine peptidase, partial [Candidatus Cloacimonadota bacterium]|nr:C25 family cysteine peptidase [Candidatus Cloacimonadota bacterium]